VMPVEHSRSLRRSGPRADEHRRTEDLRRVAPVAARLWYGGWTRELGLGRARPHAARASLDAS
jgi:hypothetical protein